MADYVVQQGDCLSRIANRHGFRWQTLWSHPRNAELKRKRKDPNVLYPGDVVHIPDKSGQGAQVGSDQRHRFKLKSGPVMLRLRLTKNDKPRSNETYQLEIDGKLMSGTTNADGRLEHSIPATAREGTLMLSSGTERYPLKLGHLDPVDEVSGVQARLRGLGFYRGAIDGLLGPQTATAIRGFQRKKRLEESGEPDQQTRDALKSEFGS